MALKVYLAGPYQWKERIAKYRDELHGAGFECTSSWLDEQHNPNIKLHELLDAQHAEYALRDEEDIKRSDVFVLFAVPPDDPPIVRAGRHVEFGMARALGKKLIVIGGRENIFHYLPGVVNVKSWNNAIGWLDFFYISSVFFKENSV